MRAAITRPLGLAASAAALLSLLDAAPRAHAPQAAETLARDLDAIMTAVYKPDGPGAVVIVTKNGQVLFRKAYGLASVELGVPMRPEMVFPVASITKQFTAAAILMLAEQGKLSLDDPITKFLPAYPTRGARITIEHLLTHTSGISSLTDLADLRATGNQEAQVADLLTDWIKDQPMDSAPGERFAYLNWGYTLLGAIIERASGQTYADFLQQRIFDPLGLARTTYADRARVIPWRASGYTVVDGSVFNVVPDRGRIVHPRAAAGVVSTVDDLARWNAGLDEGRVASLASRARMFTPYRLAGGESTRYGYAWDIGEYDGQPVQEHTAGTSGFLCHVLRMPADGLYVAILSNLYSLPAPTQATAHRVAAMAIGKPLTAPKPIALDAAALDSFAGSYRTGAGSSYAVTRSAAGLTVQVPGFPLMPLIPVAAREFRADAVTWRFIFEGDGASRAARLRVRDWTLDDVAERLDDPPPAPRPLVAVEPARLDACAGEYELITGISLAVRRDGDHLVVQPAGGAAAEIFAVSGAEFVTKDNRVRYTFLLDATGRVRGLRLKQGTRELPARRIG